MAINWNHFAREGTLTFHMVSPNDKSQVYGELDGVILGGSSLSASYYTDTRTSGKLTVLGDSYMPYRNSFIRITYEVPSIGHRRVLGTYLVRNDNGRYENGAWVYELELQSMLYGLSTELGYAPLTFATGAKVMDAAHLIVSKAAGGKVKYADNTSDATNKTFPQPLVLETGSSQLARLYDVCKAANVRLDVGPSAEGTFADYVEPSKRASTMTIRVDDLLGFSMDGVELSTNWHEMASVAAVTYKYTVQTKGADGKTESVQKEINAQATIGNVHQNQANRGWTVTSFETLSDVENPTQAMADQKAKENLEKNSKELVEWKLSTMYVPLWEGDVVDFVVPSGPYKGTRKCLVKNVELELEHMTMELTLKETASGDEET